MMPEVLELKWYNKTPGHLIMECPKICFMKSNFILQGLVGCKVQLNLLNYLINCFPKAQLLAR